MLYRWLISCFLGRSWLSENQARLLMRGFRNLNWAVASGSDVPEPTSRVRRSFKLSALWAVAVMVSVHRNLVAAAFLVLIAVSALHLYAFVFTLGVGAK
jgi:hypothetical protein